LPVFDYRFVIGNSKIILAGKLAGYEAGKLGGLKAGKQNIDTDTPRWNLAAGEPAKRIPRGKYRCAQIKKS